MKRSAGILPFKHQKGKVVVYLGHMGGPFWRKKPRAWSVVKGEVQEDETPFDAALREFHEEVGITLDRTLDFIDLGIFKTSHKYLYIWAVETDLSTEIHSNTFEMEWPRGSGRKERFLEVDRAEWISLEDAKKLIVESQIPILKKLELLLED